MNYFKLGGFEVPTQSILEFSQRYPDEGAYTDHIMMAGNAERQENFSKINTVLTGRGWVPVGLDGLDYSSPMELWCAAPKVIPSLSNILVLPAERRTDAGYEPLAYGLVNGERVATTVNISVNTATADIVAGASGYEFEYFPKITVLARLIDSGADVSKANFTWRINARESS